MSKHARSKTRSTKKHGTKKHSRKHSDTISVPLTRSQLMELARLMRRDATDSKTELVSYLDNGDTSKGIPDDRWCAIVALDEQRRLLDKVEKHLHSLETRSRFEPRNRGQCFWSGPRRGRGGVIRRSTS